MRATKIVLLLTAALTISSFKAYALIYANETCSAYYPDGCVDARKRSAYPSMGQLIVEGAGYFLKSNSDILLFLNRFELSEINGIEYVELRENLDSAIQNMERAKAVYCDLSKIAALTPYNPAVIEMLKSFDYQGFQDKNGLNGIVFDKVRGYLSEGEVTGVYNHLFQDCDNLLNMMYEIKGVLDSDNLPETSSVWRLNQYFSEALLFGQYLAEVFYRI